MAANQSLVIDTFIQKVKKEIASLSFSINKEEETVTIPPIHEEFGAIEIINEGDELIVEVGNFTHWHAACYDTTLTTAQRAESIAEDVVEFLQDLFDDKIILWGSHRGGGGFTYREEPFDETVYQYRDAEASPLLYKSSEKSSSKNPPKWLWSGPLLD